MCEYTQVEYRCGHVRYTVRAWCIDYETTHKRCPPCVVAVQYRRLPRSSYPPELDDLPPDEERERAHPQQRSGTMTANQTGHNGVKESGTEPTQKAICLLARVCCVFFWWGGGRGGASGPHNIGIEKSAASMRIMSSYDFWELGERRRGGRERGVKGRVVR
ncbi:hypothetical protein MBM_09805 [Drepanopeziza brunnea f. sp. 'multigermtubi' MB_m1]|uniref:Uncharacterized protein n=1 Tax=Marssonina brunnea f. sp. multigermtubi (strain MB_m1) TaxID=1072389 RepID=K1WGN6_MARBU|nr:uncharacterized protein MBM_09805 [Drepanopeziza brunnea f. sp. 'multigermtubi' MB_m1]EKD12021.1 hypothetical protein MBM_09805 [Drepanopeziza brunnea f. sp. 'multigermtubi' MB_m1]